MAKRKIILIDEGRCNGCGQCVVACAEGAIEIRDGKARIVSETYCDGLGACVGECPRRALTVIEREAPGFDEAAVARHLAGTEGAGAHAPAACPGSAVRSLGGAPAVPASSAGPAAPSRLANWPVQLALVPPGAPFLRGADLLVCADCVPAAVPDFHERYLAGRALVVGCPKLDDLGAHRDKLAAILREAGPRSVTVLRMEVPCCSALAGALIDARDEVAPALSVEIVTIGVEGGVVERETASAVTRTTGGAP
ncbi:MAG: 4Fe-4S binding protein [Candidatus Coatesbacteria bacterium]